jgi:hypothetical protein
MKLRNNGIISKGEYENRTLEDAIEYAKLGGFTTRIVENNGQSFMLTMDLHTDRLNFRVNNNIVIDCYCG